MSQGISVLDKQGNVVEAVVFLSEESLFPLGELQEMGWTIDSEHDVDDRGRLPADRLLIPEGVTL